MDVVPVTAFLVSALNGVLPTNMQMIGAAITATALVLNNLNQRKMARQAVNNTIMKTSVARR
jgi:hypothetical protein